MKWFNVFFKLAVIVIAIVLLTAGIFLWKHYDPEEARLREDAKAGNKAARDLLAAREEYWTAQRDNQLSRLIANAKACDLASGETRRRIREFEECVLTEDSYLYKDDGHDGLRPDRQFKGGQLIRVFWENSQRRLPSYSENFVWVSILREGEGEDWGYIRETRIGKRPSMDGSWWDLPLKGDQILHRGVKLMPGQRSSHLSFVINGRISYRFWIPSPSVSLQAWVNGKEVVFSPGGYQECPHIRDCGIVQVQLSSLETEPQIIRFEVERL